MDYGERPQRPAPATPVNDDSAGIHGEIAAGMS